VSTIAERVAAGAAFLDEHDPDWWKADVERAIDLETLALDWPDRCVLGQRCPLEVLAAYVETDVSDLTVFDSGDGYFAYGERLSGFAEDAEIAHWARDLGFTFTTDLPGGDRDDWDDLTAEWRKVITERRAAS